MAPARCPPGWTASRAGHDLGGHSVTLAALTPQGTCSGHRIWAGKAPRSSLELAGCPHLSRAVRGLLSSRGTWSGWASLIQADLGAHRVPLDSSWISCPPFPGPPWGACPLGSWVGVGGSGQWGPIWETQGLWGKRRPGLGARRRHVGGSGGWWPGTELGGRHSEPEGRGQGGDVMDGP